MTNADAIASTDPEDGENDALSVALLNLLVTSYQQEIGVLQATLDLVRADIIRVLKSSCSKASPHPDLLRLLLYPEQERIAEHADVHVKKHKKEKKDN